MLWKWGDLRQSNYFPPLSSEKSQICQFDCLSLKASKKKKKLSLSRSPYKQNGTCVVKELLESSFEEIYIFYIIIFMESNGIFII